MKIIFAIFCSFFYGVNMLNAQKKGIEVAILIHFDTHLIESKSDLDSVKNTIMDGIKNKIKDNHIKDNDPLMYVYLNGSQDIKLKIHIRDSLFGISTIPIVEITTFEKNENHYFEKSKSYNKTKPYTLKDAIETVIHTTITHLWLVNGTSNVLNTETKNIENEPNFLVNKVYIIIKFDKNIKKNITDNFTNIIINSSNASQMAISSNFKNKTNKIYSNIYIFIQSKPKNKNKNNTIIYSMRKNTDSYILESYTEKKGEIEPIRIEIGRNEYETFQKYYTNQIINTYTFMRVLHKID